MDYYIIKRVLGIIPRKGVGCLHGYPYPVLAGIVYGTIPSHDCKDMCLYHLKEISVP